MASSQEPPWHHHLTLDTLVVSLSRSIFHPFITLLIPLSLRACAKPYTAPSMQLAIAWSTLVIIYHLLSALNTRLAYGAPREVDWEEEVVVITGGSSGLGKVLAEMYGMRGASVAVVDVRVPGDGIDWEGSEALQSVKWYKCDVSNLEDVKKARQDIEKDLGTPTVLINNAAAPPSTTLLLSTSPEAYTKTLEVNLLSHFHTLTTFLPCLLASEVGGTIVTISSVLGKLGASNLTPYTASKAGLLALHNSLTAELRSKTAPSGSENIRTVLVTPGQLSTALFAGIEESLPWYAHFLGPVVEPVELAKEIVRVVDSGMSGEVSLPLYASWIEWMFVLPKSVQRAARWIAGIDRAMEGRSEARNGDKKER